MCDIEIVVGIDLCGLKKVMIIEFRDSGKNRLV